MYKYWFLILLSKTGQISKFHNTLKVDILKNFIITIQFVLSNCILVFGSTNNCTPKIIIHQRTEPIIAIQQVYAK